MSHSSAYWPNNKEVFGLKRAQRVCTVQQISLGDAVLYLPSRMGVVELFSEERFQQEKYLPRIEGGQLWQLIAESEEYEE
jgi:hypothetical protein